MKSRLYYLMMMMILLSAVLFTKESQAEASGIPVVYYDVDRTSISFTPLDWDISSVKINFIADRSYLRMPEPHQVYLRISFDNWKSYSDYPMAPVMHPPYSNYSFIEVNLVLTIEEISDFQFCYYASAENSGDQVVWDSNHSQNWQVNTQSLITEIFRLVKQQNNRRRFFTDFAD